MNTYGKFRPTGFDPAGAFLDDRQEWLVVPVSQTRDSGALDQSNFAAALAILGGESDTVEVHRFGHWGPGWFEIIIVKPGTEEARKAEEIQDALDNYPVLDDEDFSRREWEEFEQSWDSYGWRDFILHLGSEFNLLPTTMEFLEEVDKEEMREFYCDHARIPYECDDSGANIRIHTFDCDRDTLARFIRERRKTESEASK